MPIAALGGIAGIVVLMATRWPGCPGRGRGSGGRVCRSGPHYPVNEAISLFLGYMEDITLAILALKNERSRNLNLSNSVCRTTRVKLAWGDMVPVVSSIVDICTGRGQYHTTQPPLSAWMLLAYLVFNPLHHTLNQTCRVREQFWRRALVHPCSCEGLEVEGALGEGGGGDGGEDVLDVVVHGWVISSCCVVVYLQDD